MKNHLPITRRHLIYVAGAAGAVLGGCSQTQQQTPGPVPAGPAEDMTRFPAQTRWLPEPHAPPGMREGLADIGPVRLHYWDCGGDGEPVVLQHAYTGSAECWAYQRHALAAAGYRPIAYSRRGHYGSDRGPENDTGRTIDDLLAIADFLGLARFHLVGTAAGGFSVTDFALSYPDRLLSITLACTLGGIVEPEFEAASARIRTRPFVSLPAELKELGPSYRAINPDGAARWIELERRAQTGPRITQGVANRIDWQSMNTIRVPAMAVTGDADMYMPPSMLRLLKAALPHWRTGIFCDSGHSAFWEQPDAFNAALIDFFRSIREESG